MGLRRARRRSRIVGGDGRGEDAVVGVALAAEVGALGEGEDLVLAGAGAEDRQEEARVGLPAARAISAWKRWSRSDALVGSCVASIASMSENSVSMVSVVARAAACAATCASRTRRIS